MAPDGYAIAPTPLDPIRGLCYVDARRILATPTLPPRGSAMSRLRFGVRAVCAATALLLAAPSLLAQTTIAQGTALTFSSSAQSPGISGRMNCWSSSTSAASSG